jgi:hypothetical protein
MIGGTIILEGVSYTVVGVMPAGFQLIARVLRGKAPLRRFGSLSRHLFYQSGWRTRSSHSQDGPAISKTKPAPVPELGTPMRIFAGERLSARRCDATLKVALLLTI